MTQHATYREIISQPDAWQEALDVVNKEAAALRDLFSQSDWNSILFTGCGSTYYLSLAAAALWQSMLHLPARGIPAGELFLNPQVNYPPLARGKLLLAAISRSGTTSETIAAVERFRRDGRGQVIVVTNNGDAPLAELGDLTIAIPSGQEQSVAQTRSFASMYVAAVATVATLAGRDDLLSSMTALPALGRQVLAAGEPWVQSVGQNLDLERFYFLGSGIRYGLACEANLKMKEMTLTDSEPFHFFEFRHGPMSMVSAQTAVVGLLSDARREYEAAVLEEMRQLGGHVLSVAEQGADISFDSGLPEIVRGALYLPPLQLLAYHRAVAKGLDPDRPANLNAVVRLDLAGDWPGR